MLCPAEPIKAAIEENIVAEDKGRAFVHMLRRVALAIDFAAITSRTVPVFCDPTIPSRKTPAACNNAPAGALLAEMPSEMMGSCVRLAKAAHSSCRAASARMMVTTPAFTPRYLPERFERPSRPMSPIRAGTRRETHCVISNPSAPRPPVIDKTSRESWSKS